MLNFKKHGRMKSPNSFQPPSQITSVNTPRGVLAGEVGGRDILKKYDGGEKKIQ